MVSSNNLIVIENGQLHTYLLDDKLAWELGRPSKNNQPDIKLYSTTVSRKHGKFQNLDGIWFYIDYNGKNGTVYNEKHITTGIKGRVKPIMLAHGDKFVFGGGTEAVISPKTVWAMFSAKALDARWKVVDTKDWTSLVITDEENSTILDQPQKGTVIERNKGIAIYMGDLTYLSGELEAKEK